MIYPSVLVSDYEKLVAAARDEIPDYTDNLAMMEAFIYVSLRELPWTPWIEKLFAYHFEKGYGKNTSPEL